MFYRDTWAEIDLDAFDHNIQYLKEKVNHRAIFAVIKANAYGHGDEMIARECFALGCPLVCVSSVDEAMALRIKGIDGDILMLGFANPQHTQILIDQNIITTVPSVAWMEEVCKYHPKGLRVHLKVNTGMNRLGITTLDEFHQIRHLCEEHGCIIEGIFTHFLNSATSPERTKQQFEDYKTFVLATEYSFKWKHCSNSDGVFTFKEDFCNAVRTGISMYGFTDVKGAGESLKPVLSLYSRVSQTKLIHKGETVGYDATYTASNDEYIATLPLGYADGFARVNQGHYAYIGRKPSMIVGKICMDQLMIRCDQTTQMGDIVEFVGEHRSLMDIEEETGVTTFEFLTGLVDRVPRVYLRGNEVIGDINPRMLKAY